MKFPFPFKSTDTETTTTATTASAWPWPSCATSPRTLSFRAATTADNIYKTISPAYLDDEEDRKNPINFATATPEESPPRHYHETAVISGVRSDRLFFEPGETSSILEEAKTESVAMVVIDSRNPFLDFRVSMEEMMEARGLKDWEMLEELLEWYLRVNDESNHGCIVRAFLDLLVHRLSDSAIDENSSSSSSSSCSDPTKYSFTSPLSFSSSLISIENEGEIVLRKNA